MDKIKTLAINAQIQASKAIVFNQPLEKFFEVTRSADVARLVASIRETQDAQERRKLKSQLPFRCPHYFRFSDNHRAQDAIIAEEFTFQTCVDIDDMSQVEEALSRAYLINTDKESLWAGHLLHAERSASGKLHLDIRIPVGMTIKEAQMAYTQALGIDFDEDCCSPERMIYITDEASQLYTSEDWYQPLSEEDIEIRRKAYTDRGLEIDGREKAKSPMQAVITEGTIAPTNTDYPQDYKGIPYAYIVEELADQLGGAPEHGSRNDFIFNMVCHLRHVCNNDPQWIRQILPNFGEAQERVDETILSGCKRAQASGMSRKMQLVLDLCRRRLNAEGGTAQVRLLMVEPKMPERLPAPVRLLTSKAPSMYHPAIANAIFPALATHLNGVKLEYWTNEEMEASLMVLLLAEFSGGKSSIKKPIELIVEQLEKDGMESRKKMKEWSNEYNTKGANADKPQRPEGLCVQIVDSNMTNAALVRLLEDAQLAGDKRLFTLMDEVEMLRKVGNGSLDEVTEIIRRAFDTDLYGQERVSTQAVTARVPLRWNFVASSTQANAVRMFKKHISNGTFSRLNLCTIIEDPTVDFPVFGKYDDKMRSRLAPYLQLLSEAKGLIVCPQAKRLAKELSYLGKERAALTDDENYEKISRRAAVIAFRKAVILYLMNGRKWSKDIEDFIRWSFDYDMWCKIRIFSKPMQEQLEQERSVVNYGSPNMLDLLPDRFTREDLKKVRRQLGKKENPTNQLSQWTRRQFIILDERTGDYLKTETYLSKHVA